jgi:hypothetical protein
MPGGLLTKSLYLQDFKRGGRCGFLHFSRMGQWEPLNLQSEFRNHYWGGVIERRSDGMSGMGKYNSTGMMESWNIGIVEKTIHLSPNIPLFHSSSVAVFS